jgi:hypothetical protein
MQDPTEKAKTLALKRRPLSMVPKREPVKPSEPPPQLSNQQVVARAADAAEKLINEVQRLRRDVQRLAGRIEPFVDEKPMLEPEYFKRTVQWTAADAFNVLDETRASVRACEYELTAIRGRMDAIESDAISRAEMKPWIHEAGRSGK